MREALIAVAALEDRDACIKRCIGAVLLRKAMFLFYYSQKGAWLSAFTTWQKLIGRALNILTSQAIDDFILKSLDVSDEALAEVGLDRQTVKDANLSMVELVILLTPGETRSTCAAKLDAMTTYKNEITLKMTAHLQLTADNIARRCDEPLHDVFIKATVA